MPAATKHAATTAMRHQRLSAAINANEPRQTSSNQRLDEPDLRLFVAILPTSLPLKKSARQLNFDYENDS